jgi:hypothetical protein
LAELSELLELELTGSILTFDPGFDTDEAAEDIRKHTWIPVIKPNPRGTKDETKLHEQFEAFDAIKADYKKRHHIERTYAWEDTYRRLVIRYETRHEIHQGFKYLAYSMINLRWFVKSK